MRKILLGLCILTSFSAVAIASEEAETKAEAEGKKIRMAKVAESVAFERLGVGQGLVVVKDIVLDGNNSAIELTTDRDSQIRCYLKLVKSMRGRFVIRAGRVLSISGSRYLGFRNDSQYVRFADEKIEAVTCVSDDDSLISVGAFKRATGKNFEVIEVDLLEL